VLLLSELPQTFSFPCATSGPPWTTHLADLAAPAIEEARNLATLSPGRAVSSITLDRVGRMEGRRFLQELSFHVVSSLSTTRFQTVELLGNYSFTQQLHEMIGELV
jgi:hypothetical protein